MRSTLGILLLAAVVLLAACVPEPTRPRPDARHFRLPAASTRSFDNVTVHTFENGLTLIHQQNTSNRIVGATVYIRFGAADDSDNQAGLTNLMARVLTKGTTTRTSDDIGEELGRLGASVSASAGQDFIKVSMQCINDDFAPTLAIAADVMKNPVFPVEELETERRKVLAGIRMTEDQPGALASRRFRRELFGTHPYGRPVEGEPATVASMQTPDLMARHRAVFVPSNMVFAVVGNVGFEETRRLVATHFGYSSPPREERYKVNKIIAPNSNQVTIEKDTEQAFIVMGHLICPAGHPDEPALEVAAAILGSGMSSRLFRELRDKRGLAYAIGASTTFLQDQGVMAVYMGTAPSNIPPDPQSPRYTGARGGIWAEIEKLQTSPASDDEIERAKNYIAGEYVREHERNASRAGYLAYWYITGRGVEYDTRYLDDIRAVTARDIMRVANKYFLDPTVVVVGPVRPDAVLPAPPQP